MYPALDRVPWLVHACILFVMVWLMMIQLPGSALGAPNGEEFRHPLLEAYGLVAEDLPEPLYVVRPRGLLPALPGLTVHGRSGADYIVSGDDEILNSLAVAGCRLARLDEVAPHRQTSIRRWERIPTPDPAVQAMVDQVVWEGVAEKIAWLESYQTRYTFSPQSYQAANDLAGFLAGQNCSVFLQLFTLSNSDVYNVVATKLGSVYPDSFFVICGHYDSVSDNPMVQAPGADDNASGVAAVLTAAEIFSQRTFEYSIRYICFGGEEQGLQGSSHYAYLAGIQDEGIVGVLNFDMLGWWKEGVDFDLEIETNEDSEWLAAAVTNAADLYTDMPYQLHVNNDAWWGDHYPFWLQGFSAVNHEESYDWGHPDFNPYYHSTQDLLVHLDPDFTTGNVKIAVAAMATLAQLDEETVTVELMTPPVPYAVAGHPNPFNGQVTFSVTAPRDVSGVQLDIFDVTGRRVDTLPVPLTDGRGAARWSVDDVNGRDLSSGVYFCKLADQTGISPLKIVYVK